MEATYIHPTTGILPALLPISLYIAAKTVELDNIKKVVPLTCENRIPVNHRFFTLKIGD